MNLMSLAVKVMCDDQASSAIGKISSGIKTGLATAAKAATAAVGAAAAGAAVVGKSALDAYASYEQLVGGVDKLYGSASGKLQQYANQAYQTAGMSANQYMQQATSFSAALVTSLGGDVEAAADQADVAMRAIADNVNVFGTNIEDVQRAFQGFARGNYEMLDNIRLGYGQGKEEMQRLIDDANKLRVSMGQTGDLSIESFSDVVTAIKTVQDEMGITGTTANEAAKTISGSVASMKAAWDNWLVSLADPNLDLGEYTNKLVDSVIVAAGNIVPRVGVIASQIGTVIQERGPEIASKAGAMLIEGFTGAFNTLSVWVSENFNINLPQISTEDVYAALNSVAQVLQTLKDNADWLVPSLGAVLGGLMAFNMATTISGVITGITTAFTAWRTATEGMTIAQAALNMVMNANPFILVATIIGTLVGAFITLMATNEQFRTTVMNAWGAIQGAAASVWGALIDFFTVRIPGALQTMIGFFASLPGTLWGFLSSVISNVGSFVSGIISDAARAGSGFLSGISDGFNSVVSFVAGIPDRILGALGDLGGMLFNAGSSIINGLADGIWSAVDAATSAVSGVLDQVRQFLPFSPAKKGPFSGKGWTLYSGQSMVSALADGMSGYGSKAVSAMEGIMSDVSDAQALNTYSSGASKGYAGQMQGGAKSVTLNVTINGAGKDAREIAQELYNLEQRYDRGWR